MGQELVTFEYLPHKFNLNCLFRKGNWVNKHCLSKAVDMIAKTIC